MATFAAASTWEEFVDKCRDPRGGFHPDVKHLPHRAAHMRNCLRTRGATVGLKTGKWTRAQKLDALKCGSHQSACQHSDFLCEEFDDMNQKGHWVLLLVYMVLDEENLRLSPLGVVPQRDRRPRTICNYTLFSVNLDTIPLASSESMQFGKALWWILQQVSTADPQLGPVHLSKIDIADGFCRIWINPNDAPKLGVVFPGAPGDKPLIGFPLVLPIGWMQSPPLFTAATETVADLANQQLQANVPSTQHRLDLLSETAPLPEEEGPPQSRGTAAAPIPAPVTPSGRPRAALKSWDVYVDDFIGMVQGNHKHRRHVKRFLLHALDRVFRKLDKKDGPHCQEPASIKKMKKGDATWATRKIILGLTIDTLAMTVELPPHQVERIFELLDSVTPGQHRISTNKWQKLVGELRSMVLAIPGGRGLFGVFQEVLKHRCDNGSRVRLTSGVHSILQDFRGLARDLARRPTRIAELIPASLPATLGAQDAAGPGMGGI
jgi:hypothetical protein